MLDDFMDSTHANLSLQRSAKLSCIQKQRTKKKETSKKQFFCSQCSLPFASKYSLKRHVAVCQSKKKTWKCTFNDCDLFFFKVAALKVHLSLAHNKKIDEDEEFRFQCDVCSRYFSAKKILNHHSVSCKKSNSDSKHKWSCHVDRCHLKFHKAIELRNHLRNAHEIIVTSEKLDFISYEDFLHWKEHEEEATFSYFPKHNKTLKKENILYERFVCQKHGPNKPHKQPHLIKNIRKNKKGRSKTNDTCLAQMIVTSYEDGSTKVEYTKTHSHPLNLENVVHHPTPKKIRDQVVELLSRGICPQTIQKTLLEDNMKSQTKRLINLKNIKYLREKLQMSGGIKKPIDDISEALADITHEITNYLEEDYEKILGPVLFDEKEIERIEMADRLDRIDQYLEKIVSLRNKINVDTRTEIVELVETSLYKVKNDWETLMSGENRVKVSGIERLPDFKTIVMNNSLFENEESLVKYQVL